MGVAAWEPAALTRNSKSLLPPHRMTIACQLAHLLHLLLVLPAGGAAGREGLAADPCWSSPSAGAGAGHAGCYSCVEAGWTPPASYGDLEPVHHHRCIARRAVVELNGPGGVGTPLTVRVALASPAAELLQPRFHMQHVKVAVKPLAGDTTEAACDERLGVAVLLQVPDLFNLYHTFFDMLAPLAATLASAGAANATLLLAHDPVITGAMPWLAPDALGPPMGEDEPAAGGAASDAWDAVEASGPGGEHSGDRCGLDGGGGPNGYQFLGYLQALGPLRWLTPASAALGIRDDDDRPAAAQHRRCLAKLELRGTAPPLPLQPPGHSSALRLKSRRICVDELHMDVDTELSMWGLEGKSASDPAAHPRHRAVFTKLFRGLLMPGLGVDPVAAHSASPQLTLLLRGSGGVSRPTRGAATLQAAVEFAAVHWRVRCGAGRKFEGAFPVVVADAAALSLSEQVRLFSKTALLVGDHGAGARPTHRHTHRPFNADS